MPFEIWFTMNIYSNLDLVVTKGDHYIQGSCQVLHAITLVTNEVIRRQVEAKARHGRGQKEAVKIFFIVWTFLEAVKIRIVQPPRVRQVMVKANNVCTDEANLAAGLS